MINDSMRAWLGPAFDELEPFALARFERAWAEVNDRYPDPDDQDVRTEVLSAVVQYLLGDATVATAAAKLASAREAQRLALEAGKAVALMAVEDGMTEQAAAEALGVNRTTLRRAAGKQPMS